MNSRNECYSENILILFSAYGVNLETNPLPASSVSAVAGPALIVFLYTAVCF